MPSAEDVLHSTFKVKFNTIQQEKESLPLIYLIYL